MDTLYEFVLYGVVVLGVVVIALSIYVLASRVVSDRRQGRNSRLRSRIREAVEACLAGRLPVGRTLGEFDQDRKLALGVLLGLASTCGPAHQSRLRELAHGLDFEPAAIRALAHRNPAVRARAATRIGYLGSEAATSALLHALHDDQLDVRLSVAEALVQLQHVPAIMPILDALSMPGRWPSRRATEQLLGFGLEAVMPLRRMLDDRDMVPAPARAVVAINVLGILGAREALPEVMGWTDHEETEIRVAVARALGGMGDGSSAPALARLLVDERWEVRSMAAKSLGQLAEPSTIPILERALTDPAWWVRFNTAQTLSELGAGGIEALQRTMSTQQDEFARDISRQLLEEHKLRLTVAAS